VQDAFRTTIGLKSAGEMEAASAVQKETRNLRSEQDSASVLYDILWIAFIWGVSSAPRSMVPGLDNPERFFWLPADLAVLTWFLLDPKSVVRLLWRERWLVSWAALACLSALWSLVPSISLYHGLQLLATILAGVMLWSSRTLNQILRLLFFALLVTQAQSFILSMVDPAWAITETGEWRGAFSHKNELGAMMVLQVITASTLLLSGWRPISSGVGIVCALILLALSKSSTSMVALTIAMSVLPFAASYKASGAALPRSLGIAFLFAAIMIWAVGFSGIDPMEIALSELGKDSTLTGRTILWDYGVDAIDRRPILGYGYQAYWESSETTALLARYAVGQKLWFFHNVYIEVAVAFGLIGPILLTAGLGAGLTRSLVLFRDTGAYVSLWPVLFVVYLFPYLLAENPLFQNHGIFQFLFAIALCPGLKSIRNHTLGV